MFDLLIFITEKGFYSIKVRGELSSAGAAPIAVANHVSWIDPLVLFYLFSPSFVMRKVGGVHVLFVYVSHKFLLLSSSYRNFKMNWVLDPLQEPPKVYLYIRTTEPRQ